MRPLPFPRIPAPLAEAAALVLVALAYAVGG